MKNRYSLLLSISLSVFCCSHLFAWQTINGVAICTAAHDQFNPTIVSDDTGGAIIAWWDYRNGGNLISDIYVQRVNSFGSTLWTLNGVTLCTTTTHQFAPMIVSDGSGGAIITWEDYRSGSTFNIYAQRVNSNGSTLWTLNGVTICTAVNNQYSPKLVSDGSSGAIITWVDYRNNVNYGEIYAQRVNSVGSTLWMDNGVPISVSSSIITYLYDPFNLVSDGSSGAIMTWVDFRHDNGSVTNVDIYSQRVNSQGSTLWTTNGIAICTAASNQLAPTIAGDGSGGAIITWEDQRFGTTSYFHIYAQHVNSQGSTLWTTNGIAISNLSDYQISPTLVSDGSGGAIIVWQGNHFSFTNYNYDVYAQRVNSQGSSLWTTNGISVCSAQNDQWMPTIVSDGSSGAIISWYDYRNTTFNFTRSSDIYAQRVDSQGSTLWTFNGVAVCTALYAQNSAVIVSDGNAGAIIAWEDKRSNTNFDLYAQHLDGNGSTPITDWYNYTGDIALPKRE